jgi:thiol:disulfide interchange protein DsbC
MKKLAVALTALLCFGTAAADEKDNITKTIKALQPQAEISAIEQTPIPGLYQIQIKDFDPVYMTGDGRYFFSGDLMQMTEQGKVMNITEQKTQGERAEWLAKVPEADQIVFGPKKPKAKIYVFTDVECGYCRKFHTEMEAYNAMGVEVHYLAYPRAGISSEDFTKMVNVWCAKDRQAALTKVKAGGDVPASSCTNPVAKQYNLGKTVGVKGTPAIYTPEGVQIGGYLSPEQMKKALSLK